MSLLLAPLRRPATPEDAPPQGSSSGGFGEIHVNHVRRVTAANGQSFSIVIARRTPFPTVSVSCLAVARKELIGLLVGRPRALRTAVLRIDAELREQRETAEEQAAAGTRDGVFLFTRNEGGGGGGGGGSDVEYFKAHGNFISSGGSGDSTLHGLVPDGVAQITLEYPKRVSRGPRFKPTVYPSAFRRTVRVQQNVISLRVPRGAGDAFPSRIVWRDSAREVVRIVRQERR